MTWGTDPKLIIYHHQERWWVYYRVNEGTLGTNEYIFDTFEEVIQWVEKVYPLFVNPKLKEERTEKN